MPLLQGLESVDEGGAFVGIARKWLVADGQSLGRREKGEDDLNPVMLAVLAASLDPQLVRPLALEMQRGGVVENRGQRTLEKIFRGIERLVAKLLDLLVVDEIHAPIDHV